MNYNTEAQMLPQDADGVLFDVGSLYSRLTAVPDRRQRRGRRYELGVVLVLALVAKLAGQDTPEGIAEWVRLRRELFVATLPLKRERVPCAMTYRRALAQADLAPEVDRLTREYGVALGGTSEHLALDGKTLRGVRPAAGTRGLPLLAAYVPHDGVVLMQVEVAEQTNEIPCAPHVLKVLDLQGKIVTGDALLTQRGLSQLIIDAGGDYLWRVKENQPQLQQDIAQLFAPETCLPGTSSVLREKRTVTTGETNHGRLTTRTLTVCSLLTESSTWPGWQQVFQLDWCTLNTATGERQTEHVYGVTSLKACQASPARLLQLYRAHWGIENGLHYRRDVTLHEDAGRTKTATFGHLMATLNNLVIALTIGRMWTNLAKARRFYDAHPDLALQLLLMRPVRTL
jgi:predicted transposase YbfD/YdcC